MYQSVRDAMTSSPKTISPTRRAPEAAQMMKSENVGALPIVEGDRLVGVVTDRDLAVRVLAEGKSRGHRRLRDRLEGRRDRRSHQTLEEAAG